MPLKVRLLVPLRAHIGLVSLALLLGIITGAAGIGLVATGAYLVAAAALGTPILALGVPIALVRVFGVGRGIARYAERMLSHRVTFALLTDVRVWCYRRLALLAPARLLTYRSGDLLSRLVTDLQDMEAIYLRVYSPIIVALLLSVIVTMYVGFVSVVLAGVLLAYLIIAGIGVPWLVHILSHRAQTQIVASRAALQAQLVDGLQGIADLLTLGHETALHGSLSGSHARLTHHRRRLAHVAAIHRLLAVLVAGLAMWTLLILAIWLTGTGMLHAIWLPVLALVALIAFEAVQPLGEAFAVYRGATAAAGRVYELIDATPEVSEPPRPRPAPTTFDIRFDRLSFTYHSGVPPVLYDIDLTVLQGSRVAIVGPSGSGKTTLVNLLVRFWDPSRGTIRLGGHDLREYGLNELRQSIGVVGQRTTIFNDTLRGNLLLARPDATDEVLLRALDRARLSEMVAQSSLGLDRWVGEHGTQLSGGERQRLAIARTLLLDAPVLVLDEPTANLDLATENEVFNELTAVMTGRTTLVITHRLARLEQMDEIFVLDAGRLIERGTHQQLVVQDGLYRRMLDVQKQVLNMP